ncbi:MAG: SdrD B-like domain-containing protein [Acidobacteriota bacterium]
MKTQTLAPSLRSTVLGCLALVTFAEGAAAATIHADGVVCSLADAIVAANTDTATGGCPQGDPGADVVVLGADVTLSSAHPGSTVHQGVAAGLPDVTDDLTITAGLGTAIRRDPTFTCDAMTADPVFRFLNLEAGSLRLEGLSFELGCFVAPESGSQGGGIRAADATELTLDSVLVSDFAAFSTVGSFQGGFLLARGERVELIDLDVQRFTVETSGSLQGGVLHLDTDEVAIVIEGSTFADLSVSSDASLQGGVLYSQSDLRVGGTTVEGLVVTSQSSVQGGALYVSMDDASTFVDTSFRRAAVGIVGTSSLQGGALYVSGGSSRTLGLSGIAFADVHSAAGSSCDGGAIYSSAVTTAERLIVDRSFCHSRTARADGGAARFTQDLVLRDCALRQNEAYSSGSSARGGAVSASDIVLVERCAFVDNRSIAEASMGGLDAVGGGLRASHIEQMRNVTFAGNSAQGADGASFGRAGGSGRGGGLFLAGALESSLISSVTLTGNRAVAGEGAVGFADGGAQGGGLYVAPDHTLEVIGSIAAGNSVTSANGLSTPQDCEVDGVLSSLGYNLVEFPHPSCAFPAFGDVTGLDPGLYGVGDYGCTTVLPDGSCVPTVAIDQASWAIDWGSCAESGVGDDGRGLARRQDIVGVPNLTSDACDAGAFEAQDRDGDGVTDVPDLCPNDPDPDQSDSDGDHVGDACDACDGDDGAGDSDGDGVCDDRDSCPGFDDLLDGDGDGVADGCDQCIGDDATGDADGDLRCDDVDLCPGFDDGLDGDQDGVPDGCDVCLGDDSAGDTDGDGLCDDLDASVGGRVWLDDGNGIQDGGEAGVADVTVRLYTGDGALMESSMTGPGGNYNFSPGPGSYYLEVVPPEGMAFAPRDQGTDDGVDSDVNTASGATTVVPLGAGEVVSNLDAGLEPAVIGNRVWLDANADGRQQPLEVGFGGATVRLLDGAGQEVASGITDGQGIYGFAGVDTGTYRIEVTLPEGAVFSGRDVGANDLVDSDVDPVTGLSELFAYEAGTAKREWDAGLRFPPIFVDGFESGDTLAWSSSRTGAQRPLPASVTAPGEGRP